MPQPTALVLVSHSATLAQGVAELAAQMATDVAIHPAGGTSDGRIGTGFDVVEEAVSGALEAGAAGVVLLTDLGSATMTADLVLETLDDDRVMFAPGAFVEGAVAAAVAAQSGADGAAVAAAVAEATIKLGADVGSLEVVAADSPGDVPGESVAATVTVVNPQGLHARPAAQVAQTAASFDAAVTIDGLDAASVLSIMGMGLTKGSTASIAAVGPQAQEAVDALVAAFAEGFGEL